MSRSNGFNLNPPVESKEELYRRLWLQEKNEHCWRSMESAPKITDILLYGEGIRSSMKFVTSGFWCKENTRWEYLDVDAYGWDFHELRNVTHWMPLPQPPEES